MARDGFTPHIGKESTINDTAGMVEAAASSKRQGSVNGANDSVVN